MPNFESVARRLRYRALGQSCRDKGIFALLLGHHMNDISEGTFLRITNGYWGGTLGRMKPTSPIPECHGIHGVDRSGHPLPNMDDILTKPRGESRMPGHRASNGESSGIPVESGGVNIYRPFLLVRKESLLATCIGAKTSWVEDATNQDPTTTPRNAIRYLFAHHRLPRALQRRSMFDQAERAAAKDRRRKQGCETLLTACEISSLDLRSGRLLVDLPQDVARVVADAAQRTDDRSGSSYAIEGDATNGEVAKEAQYIAAMFVQRLGRFVSPTDRTALESLQTAVWGMIPELSPDFDPAYGIDAGPLSFTVAGVAFQRVVAEDVERQPGSGDVVRRWSLSRQPYPNKPDALPSISFPSVESLEAQPPPFQLWDGRYWIRVMHEAPSGSYTVRPFREQDQQSFTQSLSIKDLDTYRTKVKRSAPGKVRWTIPAIANVLGEVVALPTYALISQGYGLEGVGEKRLAWEVRHRSISM